MLLKNGVPIPLMSYGKENSFSPPSKYARNCSLAFSHIGSGRSGIFISKTIFVIFLPSVITVTVRSIGISKVMLLICPCLPFR